MKALKIIFKGTRGFFQDGGMVLASSIAFFAIVSIVPFSIFLLSIIGYFLGEYEGFYRFFLSRLAFFFPSGTEKAALQIQKVIHFRHIGNLGILLYAFLSLGLYMSMENAMNVIFKVKKNRNYIVSLFFAVLTVTAIVVLSIASFLTYNMEPVLKFFGRTLKSPYMETLLVLIFKHVISFVLVLGTALAVYLLLPGKKVRVANALHGALFTAVMLEIAKRAFSFYISRVSVIGAIYGPLSASVFLFLWIFYSSCIFLIGAEIVSHSGQSGGRKK